MSGTRESLNLKKFFVFCSKGKFYIQKGINEDYGSSLFVAI